MPSNLAWTFVSNTWFKVVKLKKVEPPKAIKNAIANPVLINMSLSIASKLTKLFLNNNNNINNVNKKSNTKSSKKSSKRI